MYLEIQLHVLFAELERKDERMRRKIGLIMAGMMMIIGIFIIMIPWIAQKRTKDTQDNLQTEYERIVEENKKSKEEEKEPEAQQKMDYTVADFSTEGSEEPEETDKEVGEILDKQQIIGKIFCEKINIDFVVVEGAKRDNIRASIGHITGTAGMGGKGNCVLAGHRGGYYGEFFKNIHLLENGDKVVLTDVYDREYIYEVYDQFIVEPTELWVCDKVKDKNTLTLLSCEDNGTRRRIVRCRLQENDA